MNLLYGLVTAQQDGTLQIDNKDYTLHPDVIITDDEQKVRQLKDIQPGSQVKFHLKHGRLDLLLLVLAK